MHFVGLFLPSLLKMHGPKNKIEISPHFFFEPHNAVVYSLLLLPVVSVKIFSATFCLPAHSTYRHASGRMRYKFSVLNPGNIISLGEISTFWLSLQNCSYRQWSVCKHNTFPVFLSTCDVINM